MAEVVIEPAVVLRWACDKCEWVLDTDDMVERAQQAIDHEKRCGLVRIRPVRRHHWVFVTPVGN